MILTLLYWIHLTLTSIATVIFKSFFGLTQAVDQPTHIAYGSCHSLIDHVLVSNTCFLSLCQVLPPLSNSDHPGIKVVIKLRASQKPVVPPQRTIWRYSHANWSKARELINTCEWSDLASDDIDLFWLQWHSKYLHIMEESIPKVPIQSREKTCMWLSKVLRKEMVKRDGLCNKYRNVRNQVISLLRKAKSHYFHQLNPKDSMKFWKSVKYLNKKQSTIPALESDGVLYVTDQENASKLNCFFSSCFNNSHPPLSSNSHRIFHRSDCEDMYCTVEEVQHSLQSLARLVVLTEFLQEC